MHLKKLWNITASLVFLALLTFNRSASAQLTITADQQLGGAMPFTPSWIPASGSLLSGLTPTSAVGNFHQDGNFQAVGLTNLTMPGNPLTIDAGDPAVTNMANCGPNAGRSVVYTLPAATYGQNITNITVYGGWGDSGRDAQDYAILYSTVNDPTRFVLLTTIHYDPANPGVAGFQYGQADATRVAVTDASGAPLAANVALLRFDFAAQTGENGYAGYTAITVYGTAALLPEPPFPNLTVTGTNETGAVPFTPDYTVPTDSLIAGLSPSDTTGDFAHGTDCPNGTSVLTDGVPGPYNGAHFALAACGPGAGSVLTYTLTNSVNGSDLTNIIVFNGWNDGGRHGQYYLLSYSTVTAPTAFIPITTVFYSPDWDGSDAMANRVTINNTNGAALAKNVYSLRFDFSAAPNSDHFYNGWQGYAEIVVEGTNSTPSALPPSPYLTQDASPSYVATVVGDQVVFTAAYSNAPPVSLQWEVITGGVTNVINTGVVAVTNNDNVTSTLTLNKVQLINSGSYLLKAVNATNNLGISYSSGSPLVVDPAPAAVGNIITAYASQSSRGTASFSPTWDASQLNSSLIYKAPPSSSGNGSFTAPYDQGQQASGPAVLTDGTFGTNDYAVSGNHLYVTLIGNDGNAGNFVTYALTGSANGYDITNIMSVGSWENTGRDQQAYTVYYATVANPSSFLPLAVVNINPTDPLNRISFDRATITPLTGSLAANVVALKFDMTSPTVENGYTGYSEIAVFGSPSADAPTGPVVTAANEQTATPDWSVEIPNLIAGQSPSSVGSGDFTGGSGCTGVSALTDGLLGNVTSTSIFAACGSSAGTSITYTNASGWNLTNIVVYSGWADSGRDGQFYNVSYSTLSAPTTFVPLVSVAYNPSVPGSAPSANRVDIAPPNGSSLLATNVYAVQFDFTPQLGNSVTDNGWSGYAEIVLQGTNLPAVEVPVLPTMMSPTVSGGNLILQGMGGTPAGSSYTWLTATNLTTPLSNWTVSVSGSLDGTGSLSNAIPVNATTPACFFRLRMP